MNYDDDVNALRRVKERDHVFMEMLLSPNSLTSDDVRRLIERDPVRYSRYEVFVRLLAQH